MGRLWLVVVVGLAAARVVVPERKIHFDWTTFWQQLRHDVGHIVAGTALIYATYWLRAVHWAVFLSPTKKVSAASLLGSQFIGFTAVALFGRLADLTQPAWWHGGLDCHSFSQVAVFTIEDACLRSRRSGGHLFVCFGISHLKALPHHDVFVRAGVLTWGQLWRLLSSRAQYVWLVEQSQDSREVRLGCSSKSAGESVATKIIGFRDGLNALS